MIMILILSDFYLEGNFNVVIKVKRPLLALIRWDLNDSL